jgi:hypothetical protein
MSWRPTVRPMMMAFEFAVPWVPVPACEFMMRPVAMMAMMLASAMLPVVVA